MYCPRASTYTLSMEQVVFLPYIQYKIMMQHTFTIDIIHFRLLLTSSMPGPLYLLATNSELKRLLMELTGELLQNDSLRKVRAARKVGINIGPENEKVWVFSPKSVVSAGGRLLDADTSPVMWLERPINTTNILINSSLSCSIETPLDDGEAFRNLCYEIQCFMPENFLPTLASMSACVMAASYQQVIASCGCIGVPLLYGVPGSCKSEALKCGLALFRAQKSHLFNSQTTSSFLFQALTQTTIPLELTTSVKRHRKHGKKWSLICIITLPVALNHTRLKNLVECQCSHPTGDLVAASKERTHA